jgi:hypothetical protein
MDVDWMNWKTWASVGVIILIAFAIYAFTSTRENPDTTLALRPATTAGHSPRINPPAPGVGVIHTEWLESQSGSYRSERNLFAFKEPPPPPQPRIVAPPPPPIVAPPPQPVQPVEPPKPQPPQFPYHYIGTFGTSTNPLATFSGNGQIVNVRVGETIDGKFVLRSIGIESVEIGYVGFPPDLKTRIAIGQ